MLRRPKKNKTTDQAQVTMEFIFSMIVVLIMMWSLMLLFRWVGVDLAERRIAHDAKLTDPNVSYACLQWNSPVTPNECLEWGVGVLNQLDPYFYKQTKMKATWGGPYY